MDVQGEDGPADLALLLLDGGRATRLGGAHKPFLEVGGETIAARTLRLVGPLVNQTIVATSRPDPWRAWGVSFVEDALPGCAGPLAGLAAGLAASTAPLVIALAGDLPFVSPPVLVHLAALARASPGRAVVPRIGGRPEGLHAIYPAALAGAALDALHAGGRRLTDLMERVDVLWVDEPALAGLRGADLTFRNVNLPGDLEECRRLAAQRA